MSKNLKPGRSFLVSMTLACMLTMDPALAQDQQGEGYSRIQGRDPAPVLAPPPTLSGPILDFREEMRTFIQRLATYARSVNPNFMVIVRDAGDLLIKRDVQDEKIISPARTFMRSIDGIMFDGVFRGHRIIGQKPPEEISIVVNERIQRAKRAGLAVFAMDFATERSVVDDVYRAADKQGVVASVAHLPSSDLSELPPYPRRPNLENPGNVLSIKDVRNFVYIAEPAAFGRQDQFAFRIHDTNFDLVVVDPFSGREPLSRNAVETLKYKKLGARRLVFARMDLGTAASYRYYWQPNWREGSPPWIGGPFPGDPDRYFVDYWSPGWQQVMYGSENSYLFGLLAQGYDGVVLEGLRNYLAFEGNVEVPTEFAPLAFPVTQ